MVQSLPVGHQVVAVVRILVDLPQVDGEEEAQIHQHRQVLVEVAGIFLPLVAAVVVESSLSNILLVFKTMDT